MDTNNSLRFLSTLLLFTTLLFTLSCNKKEDSFPPHQSKDGVMLVLNLQTTHISDAGVRALTAEDENLIEEVCLLLFDNDNKLADIPTLEKPTDSNGNWQADMQAGNKYASAVVVANCDDLINTASFKDKTRAEILQTLILKKDRWNATPNSDGYQPIPMWGEVKELQLNADAGTLQLITFNMVRMLARINVKPNKDLENFTLKSVQLVNANDRGYVAPADNNLATKGEEVDLTKVKAPTIPAAATKPENSITGGQLYQVAEGATALINEIYTFEAAAGTDEAMLENTALIIGASLNNSDATGYFRLDFKTTEGYLDLLRNHSYNINITGVTGDGYNEPDEAFKSLESALEFNIVEWNDIDIDAELGGGNKEGNSDEEDNGDDSGNGGGNGSDEGNDNSEGDEGDEDNDGEDDAPITAAAPSNCYIVKPGDEVTFPISRVNETALGRQLSDNDSYLAQLVWQDRENLIKEIEVVDNGVGKRYIRVATNNSPGNAMVAATDEAGKILWSWHIWVVDYNPQSEWMDRNLGALINNCTTDADMSIFTGYYYQWGRKDPFPPAESFSDDYGNYKK